MENLKTKKIFISTSHQNPDMRIAKDFETKLKALGHKVFLAESDINVGEDWLDRLDIELEECDYFLLLLSKNSLESDMVLYEVEKVKKFKKATIFPIRVYLPFNYNVNYDLLKQMNKINQLEWQEEKDTQGIVHRISQLILENEIPEEIKEEPILTSTDIPIPNAPLEQPTGTIPFNSRYYIERNDDKRCYINLLANYSLIRIKAPRQYGKTSLLARLILKAKKQSYHVVSFNFQEFDTSLLCNLEALLEHIYETISDELDIEVKINKKILKRVTPKIKATKYMQKILKQLDKPLVLAIDEADRLFDYSDVSDDFFGLIRAWHEKSKVDSDWEKFKILLSHSTEPLLGIININQSPFHNVGLGVELKPFTKDELVDLALRHSLILDDAELIKFMNFIGGHPFLSRKVFFTMIDEKRSLHQIISNVHGNDSIFRDHMRRYLWILKDNPKLKELLKDIAKGESCDDDSSCYILEATGLIKDVLNKPRFSCELYEEFFSKNLFR